MLMEPRAYFGVVAAFIGGLIVGPIIGILMGFMGLLGSGMGDFFLGIGVVGLLSSIVLSAFVAYGFTKRATVVIRYSIWCVAFLAAWLCLLWGGMMYLVPFLADMGVGNSIMGVLVSVTLPLLFVFLCVSIALAFHLAVMPYAAKHPYLSTFQS